MQAFERLSMACDCKDEDEQKSVKFLIGLNTPTANQVELQAYNFKQVRWNVNKRIRGTRAKFRSFFSIFITPLMQDSARVRKGVSLLNLLL